MNIKKQKKVKNKLKKSIFVFLILWGLSMIIVLICSFEDIRNEYIAHKGVPIDKKYIYYYQCDSLRFVYSISTKKDASSLLSYYKSSERNAFLYDWHQPAGPQQYGYSKCDVMDYVCDSTLAMIRYETMNYNGSRNIFRIRYVPVFCLYDTLPRKYIKNRLTSNW